MLYHTYICVVIAGGEPSVERDGFSPGLVYSSTPTPLGRVGGECLVGSEDRRIFEH